MQKKPAKFQGNLIGLFYDCCDRLPDAFWSHVMSFFAGMIFALILGIAVTLG